MKANGKNGFDWKLRRVSEMVSTVQYGTSAKAGEDAKGVPVLRMGNIKEGELSLDSLKYLPVDHDEFPELLLRGGDLLFNRTNSAELVGKCAIYRGIPERASFASYLIRLSFKADFVPEFIANYINSPHGRNWVSTVVSQQVGQANVNGTKLKNLTVPVPPVAEQRRIVAEIEKQFTRLDSGIAAMRNVQAKLKRYRAAVLKAACEGRLVATEAELAQKEHRSFESGDKLVNRVLSDRAATWNGRGKYKPAERPNLNTAMPDGWSFASLEELSNLVTSGSRGWGEYYSNAGPQFIRAQDIKTDKLNLDTVARVSPPAQSEGFRAFAENGDILITITGANVTKSAIAREISERTYVSQHVGLVKLVEPEMSEFLFSWIVCPSHGRKRLEQWAYGAGKPGLSLEQLRALPILIPPLAEQKRIVAEVERRLSLVEGLELLVSANLQRASRLRQAILQKAFTGGFV